MTVVLLLTLMLCATAALAARTPARDQPWQWRFDVWMPQHWRNLAWCESGTRSPDAPNWRMRHGIYGGAFAFADGTWAMYRLPSYPVRAEDANPFQQWMVARRVAAERTLFWPWGCWRGSGHAWVRAGLPERGFRG